MQQQKKLFSDDFLDRYSYCFDPFLDLSVPMPKRRGFGDLSLADCLKAFTDTETLDGHNKYHCDNCKSPQVTFSEHLVNIQ
jgi:ubiquitin C-terminal hydrolase